MKKVLTIAFVIFLILFIGYNPDDAAAVFGSLGGTIGDIAKGIGQFFVNLAT